MENNKKMENNNRMANYYLKNNSMAMVINPNQVR
jgi:hypothetical protein